MRIKSIIILLFLSLNLYSQTIDYNRIDSLVNLIEVPFAEIERAVNEANNL